MRRGHDAALTVGKVPAAAPRMASAHPAFRIVMAHASLEDAWPYTNIFMNEKMTRPLDEPAASVEAALAELE